MSDKEQIELKPRPKAGGSPAPEVLSPDDTDSQALSEALQSSFSIVKFLMVGLVIVFLCSGMFTVDSGQQAIILRFGKPVGEGQSALLGPGFHWAFPRPIDEVKKVSIGQIQTAVSTVGWYPISPEDEKLKREPQPKPSLDPAVDGYALTSDANILHVRATVRYQITDPNRYLFDFVNAGEFVTNALNNAVLYGTSQFTVDEILTGKAAAFREKVTSHLQKIVEEQDLGIEIEPVEVKTLPPRWLLEKFNEVLQAGIKSEESRNRAEIQAKGALSKARADAEAVINNAQKEEVRIVKQAEAEAAAFAGLLPQFQRDPGLYMQRRQAETITRIYEQAKGTFFIPEQTEQLRLQLNREPEDPSEAKIE